MNNEPTNSQKLRSIHQYEQTLASIRDNMPILTDYITGKFPLETYLASLNNGESLLKRCLGHCMFDSIEMSAGINDGDGNFIEGESEYDI